MIEIDLFNNYEGFPKEIRIFVDGKVVFSYRLDNVEEFIELKKSLESELRYVEDFMEGAKFIGE